MLYNINWHIQDHKTEKQIKALSLLKNRTKIHLVANKKVDAFSSWKRKIDLSVTKIISVVRFFVQKYTHYFYFFR